MPSRFLRHLLLITLTLAVGLAGSGPATAATITVTNCTDTGAGTLREGITLANGNADPSNTLTFPSTACVITLIGAAGDDANLSGDLDVFGGPSKVLILQGSGTDLTIIDGGAVDRVIENNATLQISGLTIRNGDGTQNPGLLFKGGGGILNNPGGTLTLTNVALSGNTATQGGGLFNDSASATLTNVTVSGNSAIPLGGDGGGIFNNNTGTVTVTNSTISGNTATGEGGGISNNGTSVTLTNVTITLNKADNDNLLGGDGGGIVNNVASGVTIANSIVSANLVGTTGTFANCVANPNAFTSQGNNLFGNNVECSGGTSDIEAVDPGLAALADNGGPTQTHALLASSVALNAGPATGCPATDQRGNLRPAKGVASATVAVCDIGAFELQVEVASLALTLNQSTFRTGQILRANVTASNTGDAVVIDVLFGIVVPSSAALTLGCSPGVAPIAFITSVNPPLVAFRCSNASLATFPTLLQDNTLQPTAPFTVSNFFSVALPAETPPGTYVLFLAIVRAGSLDDGTLDPGDVIASSSVVFTFTP